MLCCRLLHCLPTAVHPNLLGAFPLCPECFLLKFWVSADLLDYFVKYKILVLKLDKSRACSMTPTLQELEYMLELYVLWSCSWSSWYKPYLADMLCPELFFLLFLFFSPKICLLHFQPEYITRAVSVCIYTSLSKILYVSVLSVVWGCSNHW